MTARANDSHNLHSKGDGEGSAEWGENTEVDGSLFRVSPQCPLLAASHSGMALEIKGCFGLFILEKQ